MGQPKALQKAPKDAQQPARYIIEQAPQRITGVVNLPGLEIYPNEHESNLERTGMRLFGFCHDVTRIAAQPRVESIDDPKLAKRRHFQDTAVTVNDVERTVEFKPLRRVASAKLLPVMADLGRHYRRHNIPFDIVTDDQLFQEPRLSNANILRRYLTSPVCSERQHVLVMRLTDGPRAIREMHESGTDSETFRDVCALIARRVICFDWNQQLNRDTQVSLPDKPYKGLRYEDIVNSGRFHSLLQELALGCEPTDQRLLAAARAQDWSIPDDSGWGFLDRLPKRAFVGRRRAAGRLVDGSGHSDITENSDDTFSKGGEDSELLLSTGRRDMEDGGNHHQEMLLDCLARRQPSGMSQSDRPNMASDNRLNAGKKS